MTTDIPDVRKKVGKHNKAWAAAVTPAFVRFVSEVADATESWVTNVATVVVTAAVVWFTPNAKDDDA